MHSVILQVRRSKSMKKIFLKLLLILVVASSSLYGASKENVIFSKNMDAKYSEKVYRKVTILFTEARLKLQKKYKKYLEFEYVDKNLTDKKEVIKYLKEKDARYYAYLTIKEKKKCTQQECQVYYIVKVIDAKKKKNITMKMKVVIIDNEFVEITPALIKSNTKKLVKFLKKR